MPPIIPVKQNEPSLKDSLSLHTSSPAPSLNQMRGVLRLYLTFANLWANGQTKEAALNDLWKDRRDNPWNNLAF
jgi:hypothetical protein